MSETRDLACGCREELILDWDAWVIVEQCSAHSAESSAIEPQLQRVLDAELDQAVYEAAGGRRVERIMPRDHTKERR